MKPSEIIVGVDGSLESDRALAWAAQEARVHDSGLQVLHVYDWRIYGAAGPIGEPFVTDAREAANDIVAKAVTYVQETVPGVPVRGEALLGSAPATLVSASSNGTTVVVGSRGRGGFASLLLGSVGQQVATHAGGPVVVVRGRPEPHGPIVVGMDGSTSADHALGVAYGQAHAMGAGIVAVRVMPYLTNGFDVDVPGSIEDVAAQRERERDALAADTAGWGEKFPDVSLDCVVLDGRPADVLVGLSESAQLVVVGIREHGGFAGNFLGSVGLHLIHHAHCPVLIARELAVPTDAQ